MFKRTYSNRLIMGLITFLFAALSFVVIPTDAQVISFTPYGFAISEGAFYNPTSLQFGPDDRLYVAQQNGTIWAFTVVRNSANDYSITDTEQITVIKEEVPNYNDDGSYFNIGDERQVTGIVLAGTAANPIIYVGSSDNRQGGGGSGADTGLDTNSGMISQLTWTGSDWEHLELIRGLPRSEENHANNGMFLDGNTLYVTIGGSTNAGAPSNNFAFITEYAYSGSIIAVDLGAILALPTQTENVGGQTINYKYNMPTLDDPTRPNVNGIIDPNDAGYDGIDVGDPFGGNDGLNQAKVINGGPISIHSTGWRNQYDVVITQAGNMYSVDNGANGGWGGYPPNEGEANCTNDWLAGEPGSNGSGPAPNFEDQVNNQDNLQYIPSAGFYAGHPVPVRGNPAGAGLFTHEGGGGGATGTFRTAILDVTDPDFEDESLPVDWPPVPSANPVECDFLMPGVDDGALATWGASTNGITEYTASNFSNQLQGDLLTASFDGTIYRFDLASANTGSLETFASGFGATPLDVIAQGDADIFPGTVWAVTYGADDLTVFEPADYDGGGFECTGVDDITLDEDNDDYTNADEIDNGTDPCSGAEKPNDFDKTYDNGSEFLLSDLNDPDDDNDTLLDTYDPYPIDDTNGANVTLPIEFELFNGFPGYGFYGLGFTGLMTNGTPGSPGTDYLNLWDDANVIAGGTAGLLTMLADDGTALGGSNDQLYGFQFGINAGSINIPYTIEVIMSAPFFDASAGSPAAKYQGFYLGDGTQDNYLALVVDGNGAIRTIHEQGGASVGASSVTHAEGIDVGSPSTSTITLYMTVDPDTNEVTTAYKVNDGAVTDVGAAITVGGSIAAAMDGTNSIGGVDSEMAIGVIATSGATEDFGATWDYISVSPAGTSDVDPIYRVNAGGAEVADTPIVWTENDPTANYSTGGAVYGSPVGTNTTSAPDDIFNTERYGNQEWDFPVSNGVYSINFYFMEGFAGAFVDDGRLFDVEIEGTIPAALNDFDIYEEAGFQGNVGFVRSFLATVNDTNLDINFINQVGTATGDAAIRGIEIIPVSVASTPAELIVKDDGGATVTDVSFGSHNVGVTSDPVTLTLDNIGTDDPIAISSIVMGGANPGAFSVVSAAATSIDPNEVYTVDVTFTPPAVGAFSATMTINHDGDNGPTTVVNLTGNGYDPLAGTILHRINVGGPAVAATDAPAPAWAVDTVGSPSPFRVSPTGGDNISTTTADIDMSHVSVPPYAPEVLFTSERWDLAGAEAMQWEFGSIDIGADLVVRLYFAEIFTGADTVGARIFDVAIEGTVPAVFDDIDQVAVAGLEGAFMLEYPVTVVDGVLDIDFAHAGANNPTVKAIEIIQVGTTPQDSNLVVKDDEGAPITDVAFGSVPVTTTSDVITVTLDNLGSSADINVSDISITGPDAAAFDVTPDVATVISPTDFYDLDLTFTPPVAGNYSASLTITHDGENGPTTVINLTGVGYEELAGTILHRVNVGGPEVAASDAPAPAWGEDSAGAPSANLVTVGGENFAATGAAIDMSNGTLPPYAPEAIFQTERWDSNDGIEMEWEFAVPANGFVMVRLYFAEIYEFYTVGGERIFDVTIEEAVPPVFQNIDQTAFAGHEAGFMLEHQVAVGADGVLDIDFLHGTIDNPTVSAIEIISLTDNNAPVIDPIADQFVLEEDTLVVPILVSDADFDDPTVTVEVLDDTETPVDAGTFVYDYSDFTSDLTFTPALGTAGVYTVNVTADDGTGEPNAEVTETFILTVGDSLVSALILITPDTSADGSTFVENSISIENTGATPIVGVTFDLSTTVLPNLVFDPTGDAGDAVFKCLEPDTGEVETGYITPAGGNCSNFAAANAGLPFSDLFDGGFNIMGMEFTAGEFTQGEVFALSVDIDPTTIEGSITDGDAGSVSGLEIIGATVTVEFQGGITQSTELYTIPVANVSGSQSNVVAGIPTETVELAVQGVELDDNGAANMSYADPTLLVTGPANATVSVTQLDTGLLLTGVAECGVNLENYESNAVNGAEEYFVTLDALGEGEIDVTLFGTLNDPTDGLNYFVGSIVDDSATPRLSGPMSNTVILSYPENPNYAPALNHDYEDMDMDEGDVLELDLDGCDVGTEEAPAFEVTVFEQGTTVAATFFTVVDNEDGTGTLTFEPTFLDAGLYDVSIIATDGDLDSEPDVFVLTVNDVNAAPTIDPIDDATVVIGDSIDIDVSATDDEDDDITLDAVIGGVADAGAFVYNFADNGDGTGTLTVTPTLGTDAVYTVTVTAADASGESTLDFELTVLPNGSPIIEEIDDQTVAELDTLEVDVNVTDAETVAIAFQVWDMNGIEIFEASGMFTTVDNGDNTGSITFTPQLGDAAGSVYDVTVSAFDGINPMSTETFELTVTSQAVPVIDPIGPIDVAATAILVVPVNATDVEGDPITLAMTAGPGFASFVDNEDGTGWLTLTPAHGSQGAYTVTLEASDLSGSSTLVVDINVTPNMKPVFDPAIPDIDVPRGTVRWVVPNATDPEGADLTYRPVFVSQLPSFIRWNAGIQGFVIRPGVTHAGTYTVTVEAFDGHLRKWETFEVTVTN